MHILLADDHALFRRGVADVLRQHASVTIDETSLGNEAIALSRDVTYDAIILDITLPDRNGLDILKQIRTQRPAVPVLILSMHGEDQYAVRALRAGASGYLTKGAAAEELWDAVLRITQGGRYVSPGLGEQLAGQLDHPRQLPHERLSDREFQVLCFLASGTSARDIATQLGLSVKTVNTHRMNILAKLELRSSADLIRYAVEQKLVM